MSVPSSPLYSMFELNHAALQPFRAMANMGLSFWASAANPLRDTSMGRQATAALTMFERATRRFAKPSFDIPETQIDGKAYLIDEQVAWETPFCKLIHFGKVDLRAKQAKLLMVAPMSGHYATLLRDTVKSLLPHFDIYVTDWQDARDIPLSAGQFDLDDYTDSVITMLHHLGERAHVMAVCQPAVPVLAAVSIMAAKNDPLAPLAMVLMGGPIDTTKSPTAVNKFADGKDLDWFRQSAIMKVEGPHAGHGREVYPGFMQLGGFISMNLDRHLKAHRELYCDLVDGDEQDAARHERFYDEYMAVMDLTAEFYLQTIERVFIHQDLPHGTYAHRGVMIDPAAITQTALLTVEGERDDISGLGQTEAAHELCKNIPADKHKHHLQMGVGHYGVFSGSKFRAEVAPMIADFLNAQKP
ncbi:polyhydroxyalkanoate depolymerase [Aestuariivirga litoralis]|uniref:polyhydroxyalkanoate depolymerase n=1 Tax=Aestuariivirga litoralis TaxID=2650924 RepID=UPI0018C62390|nr:polyhydroxyalkanoate depolymerase [Aestuariivirga litoralis]MBG1233790.1 polyhydroxyalkanoate depolymerase [Aestuariivirga litoralis]